MGNRSIVSMTDEIVAGVNESVSSMTLAEELRRVSEEANARSVELVRDQLLLYAQMGHRRVPLSSLEMSPGSEGAVRAWLTEQGLKIEKSWMKGEMVVLVSDEGRRG